MLKLLGRHNSSNVQKVLWLLDELELSYERLDYGGAFGGNKNPEYLRLNPNGVVPTLIDGETVIWESNTILRYLANKVGPTDLYPTEPARRAYCERWMDWQLSTLNSSMTALYIGIIRTPVHEREPGRIAALEHQVRGCFETVDRALADESCLVGNQFTLADIVLAIFAYRWYTLEIERGAELTRLRAWCERLQGRPAFRRHVMIGLT